MLVIGVLLGIAAGAVAAGIGLIAGASLWGVLVAYVVVGGVAMVGFLVTARALALHWRRAEQRGRKKTPRRPPAGSR